MQATTFFKLLAVMVAANMAAADDLLLKIEITQQGSCSKQSKLGDTLHVNYNGTFTNGTLFDSSKCYYFRGANNNHMKRRLSG